MQINRFHALPLLRYKSILLLENLLIDNVLKMKERIHKRLSAFTLWQRAESAFHVISPKVKEWLDKELRYIRQEADTFRGRFNKEWLLSWLALRKGQGVYEI